MLKRGFLKRNGGQTLGRRCFWPHLTSIQHAIHFWQFKQRKSFCMITMVPNPIAVQYAYSWTSSIVIYTAIIHDAEWCGHNCTIYHAIMVISFDVHMKWMNRSRISNVCPYFDSSKRHLDPTTFLLLNGSQICHSPLWKNLLPRTPNFKIVV